MSETNSLDITFHRCDFIGNKYQWNGGQAALIISNSMQNRLTFDECRFENNDMTFNNTNVSNALMRNYDFWHKTSFL
jgi:hypothetical protein